MRVLLVLLLFLAFISVGVALGNGEEIVNLTVSDCGVVAEPPSPGQSRLAYFAITLSEPDVYLYVNYQTMVGTATSAYPNRDYRVTGNSTASPAVMGGAMTTILVTVPVFGDTLREGDEFFYLVLYNIRRLDGTPVVPAKAQGVCIIDDQDS